MGSLGVRKNLGLDRKILFVVCAYRLAFHVLHLNLLWECWSLPIALAGDGLARYRIGTLAVFDYILRVFF